MSVVWRADDDVLGREVAVKVLSERLAADPAVRHQILAEARAAAGLRHSTVVEVYDYGETTIHGEVLPYVVMELVDGRTLADLLSGNRIPWRLAVLICAQVAAALTAAHARGIVHRDVKPGNVMVTSAGVKLVDFGISAAVGDMDGADGRLLGTPAYLAPERIDGGPVRPATDVYALGVLLYLSLAGRMPWQASTTTQMLKAHYYVDPAPLPAVAGLPAEVARLVSRCLAKKPGERPSAAEAAQLLGRIAGLAPATDLHAAAAATEAIVVRGRWRDRAVALAGAGTARVPGGRRTLAAAAAAVALTAAGLTAWAGDEPRMSSPAAAGSPQRACTVEAASGRGGATSPASAVPAGTGCRPGATTPVPSVVTPSAVPPATSTAVPPATSTAVPPATSTAVPPATSPAAQRIAAGEAPAKVTTAATTAGRRSAAKDQAKTKKKTNAASEATAKSKAKKKVKG